MKFAVAELAALVSLSPPTATAASSGTSSGVNPALEIAARPTGLPSGAPPSEEKNELVLRAQKGLAQAGFYSGPQDGRLSTAT